MAVSQGASERIPRVTLDLSSLSALLGWRAQGATLLRQRGLFGGMTLL